MIASRVWELLGDPDHYMEPFFGSGAVLLSRKNWEGKTETVCDKDGFLANVWRGIQFAPDEVARWCDWPVNHADLMARRAHLIENEQRLLDGLMSDPKWFDSELAGYWVWAASCWIGSGLTKNMGSQIPHISDTGKGVHSTKYCQIPFIGHDGRGVIVKTDIYETMRQLSARLRRVRVVCGDFMRILGGNWQTSNWKTVGLFFDPPYCDPDIKDRRLYNHYDPEITERVEKWCLGRWQRPDHRIVVSGYDTEYRQLVDSGWTTESWKAQGGYGQIGNGRGKANRHRETLFISPHCVKPSKQLKLF